MNKSSKSKKRFKSIVSLLLVTAILITGALAYLTATDSKENKFTVGNVSIELTEPNWNEENGKNIVPGESIAKDPQIENTGLNDAYVYIMVTVPKKDQITVNENGEEVVKDNLQLFTYDVNENWTLIKSKSDDANENNYYVYAYNTTLASNVTTEPLFTEVTFANIVSDQIPSTEELQILVNGYAIQSDSVYNAEGNPATAEEAWEIYATQNGWDFPLETPAGYSSLNFIDENGVVVHTEFAEEGSPVDMYFDDTLAKDGFTFDWVDLTTNEVAYSGMPMPENDTELKASYTETGYGEEYTKGLKYLLHKDDNNELYAELRSSLGNPEEEQLLNYEQYNNSTVIIPSKITITKVDQYDCKSPDGKISTMEGSIDDIELNETFTVPVKSIGAASVSDLNPKTIVIPDSVVMYESHFASTSQTNFAEYLEEIILPYGVSTVPNSAFAYCSNLKKVILPSSVMSIGSNAFSGCTALEEVINLNLVKSIDASAFINTSALTSVDISSATLLGENAFSKTGSGMTSLANITLAEGLEVIPAGCFARTAITEIRIPTSVKSIGEKAFNACNNLSDVYYAGTEEEWNAIEIGSLNVKLTSATIHFES